MTTTLTALAEAVRLTPVFHVDRLAAELGAVIDHTWRRQRTHTYGGCTGVAAPIDWRVLPLRSLGGDPDRTDPGGPGPQPFADTRWLDRLPYLAGILAEIPAPLNAVRLMALGPGAVSQPHRDPKYRLDRGLVRIHLPITVAPGAVLVLDGIEHCWEPGTLWYGDFSREHLVRNSGTETRVHAVIDALLTADLVGWFPPDWQGQLTCGEVLLNHNTPPGPAGTGSGAWSAELSLDTRLPTGFADFDSAAPLDGPLVPATIGRGDHGGLSLTVAGRVFALTPTGSREWRFSGWSEQRTLQPDSDDGGLTLRVRRGRTLADRHVAATPQAS